jgi:tetraacyldisaccharide 4'-kinase
MPLSWGFGKLAQRRQTNTDAVRFNRPVVVIGNIVVGGTGKTLLLCWLIQQCQSLGIRVGVVSRGYRGRTPRPVSVELDSDPKWVGDEPLFIRQLNVPVVVARRRVVAVHQLLQSHPELDLVLSDDGLQHYEMSRDVEICCFDGHQSVGNGRLLPAGPMREPLARLNRVNWVVCKSEIPESLKPWRPILMSVKPSAFKPLPNSLADPDHPPSPADSVIALCGIGQPESFFQMLRQQGWNIEPMALPDHAALSESQKEQLAGRVVLMTTKDAIKLRQVSLLCQAWEVPVQAHFAADDQARILATLTQLLPEHCHHNV